MGRGRRLLGDVGGDGEHQEVGARLVDEEEGEQRADSDVKIRQDHSIQA